MTLAAMGLEPGMRTLITAPMYHSAPNAQALFAVAIGIDLTIMPRFDAEEFLALVERHADHARADGADDVRATARAARGGPRALRHELAARESSTRPRRAPRTSSGG